MPATMKSIYATISNHVQMVGYREIVEAHGKARGLAGFVFNDVDGSVKVMASGLEPVLNDFIHDLKIIRPGTAIETTDIKEDIRLPSPFGRIAVDDVLEYMARFDKGIGILTEHTGLFHGIDNKLEGIDNKLEGIDNKLDGMSDTLNSINEKLDTLPERLAEAMKK